MRRDVARRKSEAGTHDLEMHWGAAEGSKTEVIIVADGVP
jgi:hypothetical protein